VESRGFVWILSKTLPVEISGVSKDALHVHIGLIAFFGPVFSWNGPLQVCCLGRWYRGSQL